jgi:hypothetical protein
MPHPDLEELLNMLVPFAQQMLSKHGEFYPFGATMTSSGEIVANAGHTGEEQPEPQDVIKLLSKGFQQEAASGNIRAAGMCVDIRTTPPGQTEKTDAICVTLEHQSGEAVDVCVPYKKGLLGRMKYGQLFAGKRDPAFFVQNKSG